MSAIALLYTHNYGVFTVFSLIDRGVLLIAAPETVVRGDGDSGWFYGF